MTVDIVPFCDADADAVAAMVVRATSTMARYDEPVRAYFGRRYDAASLRQMATRGDTTILVAKTGAGPIGLGLCRDGQIFGMYVDPAWQRQGLGGRLLGHLEAVVRAARPATGAGDAIVEASVDAVAFYARHGYQRTEERRYTGEPPFTYVVMTKALGAETTVPPAAEPSGAQPSDEVLAVQLSEINQRVRMHASRLWQLPFAYVGVVALFLSEIGSLKASPAFFVASGFLLALGLIVVWCMMGAYEGIARGGGEIAKLEAMAGLPQTAGLAPDWLDRFATGRFFRRLTWHFVPYFALALIGAAAIAAMWVVLSRDTASTGKAATPAMATSVGTPAAQALPGDTPGAAPSLVPSPSPSDASTPGVADPPAADGATPTPAPAPADTPRHEP